MLGLDRPTTVDDFAQTRNILRVLQTDRIKVKVQFETETYRIFAWRPKAIEKARYGHWKKGMSEPKTLKEKSSFIFLDFLSIVKPSDRSQEVTSASIKSNKRKRCLNIWAPKITNKVSNSLNTK
uniref:Uncharacterized protein n=1 Tax=Spongospora subterranea TaxID=70186 RepID=A0A0H5QVI0_9EUKA|eukprot:CRZ05606.1 hypothetical protein [Spongospora subterranea]